MRCSTGDAAWVMPEIMVIPLFAEQDGIRASAPIFRHSVTEVIVALPRRAERFLTGPASHPCRWRSAAWLRATVHVAVANLVEVLSGLLCDLGIRMSSSRSRWRCAAARAIQLARPASTALISPRTGPCVAQSPRCGLPFADLLRLTVNGSAVNDGGRPSSFLGSPFLSNEIAGVSVMS